MQRQLAVTCAFLVAAGVCYRPANAEQTDQRKLIGTWRFASGTYNGQPGDFGKLVIVKHVTGTHFIWIRYEGDTKAVVATAGGPYTVSGDIYTEKPTYGMGSGFSTIRDKEHSFRWRVEGNKWYSNGQLANGVKIEEVWERVEEGSATPPKTAP